MTTEIQPPQPEQPSDGQAPSVAWLPQLKEDKRNPDRSTIIAMEQGLSLSGPKNETAIAKWWFPKGHLDMYSMPSEETILLKFATHNVSITVPDAKNVLARFLQEKQVTLSVGKENVSKIEVSKSNDQYFTHEPQQ